MRPRQMKSMMKTVTFAIGVLLVTAGLAAAQQQVNLTAAPATATLPDGQQIPMWGYTCTPTTVPSTASCKALNPAVAAGGWSPVVITVPTGQSLRINLTNNLSFPVTLPTPVTGSSNNVPTSLVIVGQVGGGLGDVTQRTTTPSPLHDNQNTTWPSASTGAINNPPPQGPRVQSFSTEVATGSTTSM